MGTIVTNTVRRIGVGFTAFLVTKIGVPEEAAQQIIIAGSVFISLAIDGIAAAIFARFK